MIPTTIVSFPRSGTYLLLNTLLAYYGRDLEFAACDRHLHDQDALCDSARAHASAAYAATVDAGVVRYCNPRLHCERVPCSDAASNLQVVSPGLGVDPGVVRGRMVWLLRDPMSCAESVFRSSRRFADVANGRSNDRGEPSPYCAHAWRSERRAIVKQWSDWFDAWADHADRIRETVGTDAVHTVRYENLVARPMAEMQALIEWLTPGVYDPVWLLRVVEAGGFRSNHCKRFEFRW